MNIFRIAEAAVSAQNTTNNLNQNATDVCNNQFTRMDSLSGITNYFSCFLIKSVVPLLVALSVAGFIWGIIQYFLNPDNEEKKKNGKSFMIWGLVALFVIVSMWGIVGLLSNTFQIRTVIPQLSQ